MRTNLTFSHLCGDIWLGGLCTSSHPLHLHLTCNPSKVQTCGPRYAAHSFRKAPLPLPLMPSTPQHCGISPLRCSKSVSETQVLVAQEPQQCTPNSRLLKPPLLSRSRPRQLELQNILEALHMHVLNAAVGRVDVMAQNPVRGAVRVRKSISVYTYPKNHG